MIGTGFFWIDSYRERPLEYGGDVGLYIEADMAPRDHFLISTEHGYLMLTWIRFGEAQELPHITDYELLGFAYHRFQETSCDPACKDAICGRHFILPFWSLLVLSIIYPAAFILRRLRDRSCPAFLRCSHCNYNLTGNTSGICPECGTPIVIAAHASPSA